MEGWIEPLAYIIGSVIVIVVAWLVKRYTGYNLPVGIKSALFQIVQLLMSRLSKKKCDDGEHCLKKSPSSKFPSPPKTLITILGSRLRELLKPYGIILDYALDIEYCLPSREDWLRFLKWYKSNTPVKPGDYTQDDFDCDDFAWIMRAYALLWMKGRCPFGYIEASSIDENYPFPMHSFGFMVDQNNKVYFTDPLELAASIDGLDPAYEINCQDVKV